jgi:hypothetical protein
LTQIEYFPTTLPEEKLDCTVQFLNSIGRITMDNKNKLGSPPQLIENDKSQVI